MKKKIAIIIMILILATLPMVLSACNDKDDEVKINEITIEFNKTTDYKKGDVFSESDFTVTAHLSDKTTRTMSNNLIWNTEGLNLNDKGEFTEAGEFTLIINFLKYKEEYKVTVTE